MSDPNNDPKKRNLPQIGNLKKDLETRIHRAPTVPSIASAMSSALVIYTRDRETFRELHVYIQRVLSDLFVYMGQDPNPAIIPVAASDIIANYPDLSIEDIDLFARTVRFGSVTGAGIHHKYEKPFGKLSGHTIMSWVADYYDVKSAVREDLNKNIPEDDGNDEGNYMSFDEAMEKFPNLRKIMEGKKGKR